MSACRLAKPKSPSSILFSILLRAESILVMLYLALADPEAAASAFFLVSRAFFAATVAVFLAFLVAASAFFFSLTACCLALVSSAFCEF